MEGNINNEYFESYEDLEIHELMLRDAPRNQAYYDAIQANPDKIKDKVILDVGTGTGFLAIMCAQAGARKVYAVEASNLSKLAKEIIKENKLEEIIEVIHGRIEEVELPEQVDVIISEWMGFYLLHEGMLDSVLSARDKFLKSDGYLFPNIAKIYVAPCSVPQLDFWKNINGVSMKTLGEIRKSKAAHKPKIEVLNCEDLLSEGECIAYLDLSEISCSDLDAIEFDHVFVTSKDGTYQGLCLWFDVEFPNSITLNTSPDSQPTHWKQTLIILPEESVVEKGEPIACKLEIKRDGSNLRRYNIQFEMLDSESVEHPTGCGCYMTKCILVKACLENYEK